MNEPNLIQFLLNIAGAAALLIWAVRLVRTGVERGFSNLLRNWLKQSTDNRILSAFSGMSAAIFLQSSTAVAVLISNFFRKLLNFLNPPFYSTMHYNKDIPSLQKSGKEHTQ